MHINIVAVGKIKKKYIQRGIEEYIKRIQPYARTAIHEIKEEKLPADAGLPEIEAGLRRESLKIGRYVSPSAFRIVLAVEGRQLSSPELAGYLRRLRLEGKSSLTFIIGGPHGLDSQFKKEADLLLSFSRFTFPHQLMRLILLEQLYRAFKILHGEPYHY